MGRVALIALVFVLAREAPAADLHDAARRGDLAAVDKLLAAGARVDATDGGGATPLYLAANEGRAALVARLLVAGGNPRYAVPGPFGSTGTPLHAAVRNGHLDVARLLLEAGVDPNLPDDGVGPPLHVALSRGQTAAAELLRSFGARTIRAAPMNALIAAADLAAGEQTVGACAVCHELGRQPEHARPGPTLWDVIDRPKAAVAGYEYSEALRAAGGRWTEEDLGSYIANPRGFVPGTKMEFRGIPDARRRAELVVYLRSLSDRPRAPR